MREKIIAGLIVLVIACTSCSKAIIKPSDEEIDLCFSLLFRAERIAVQDNDQEMIDALRGDYWCNHYGKFREDIEILEYYIKSNYKK